MSMKSETPTDLPAARYRWVFSLLFALPVLAYAAILVASILKAGSLVFARLDLALLLFVLAYLCTALLFVGARNPRYAARFLLCTYACLGALVVCELAWERIYPAPRYSSPWPPQHRTSVAGDAMPGISGTIEFTVNDLGLRGPPVRLEDVEVRILCVGGSSTECLYVTDRLTWPWLLQERLTQQLGQRVFVGNAGKAGILAIHHSYLLENYELAPRFEWVVVMCGGNDFRAHLIRHSYEYHKRTIAENALTPKAAIRRNQAYYRDLALLRYLEAKLAGRQSPFGEFVQDPEGNWYKDIRRKRQEGLRVNTIREVPEEQLARAVTVYGDDVRQIIRVCRKNRQQLVLMTQPTLYDQHLPEHLQQLLWEYCDEGAHSLDVLERMMGAFNQATIEVAREEGVDCIDLASKLSKDTTTLYDDCHFNVAGCDKVARILAEYFVAKLGSADAKPAAP
jgi:lysophospholipase L1-like esterase